MTESLKSLFDELAIELAELHDSIQDEAAKKRCSDALHKLTNIGLFIRLN